jgi:hypothetical protein
MLRKVEIKYGIIFAAVGFVWIVLEYILGFQTRFKDYHPVVSSLIFFPSVYIMVRGMLAKRKEMGGKMGFGEAFQSGFFITLVVAVLSPLSNWIFFTFINPGFFNDFIALSVEHGLSAEEASAEFNLKSYIIKSFIGAIVMGTLSSLIIALFVRESNNRNNFQA